MFRDTGLDFDDMIELTLKKTLFLPRKKYRIIVS